MSVNTDYISKRGGSYHIGADFTLAEMQCNDNTDKVLWSTDLVNMLEKLRNYGGFTIHLNCGYRTKAYNKKIGGASKSQHIYGTAADIVVKKNGVIVNAKLICCLAQTLGFKGIGYISANATHVDMRASGSYRGDERNGYSGNVGNDFYNYFKIAKSTITALKITSVPAATITVSAIDNAPSTGLVSYWESAKTLNITDGTSPKEEAKRGQVIAFIVRKITNGQVVQINDCADYASKHSISDGQNLDLYSTREQAMAMIYRFKNNSIEKDFNAAWEWGKNQNITDGSDQKGIITREEAIAFVLRSGI